MGNKSEDPNKAAMKQQQAQMERLDKLSLPELEEYLLQNPDLVGLLEAEEVDPSALEEISLDPAMREKQLKALAGLEERAEEGVTAQDRYQMEQLLGDVSAQEQARQAQIEDQMAQRGMDSSGASLMAQLQGKQSAANTARDRAMQMAAQGQQNRAQALQALGQQAGQMEQAEFGREAQVASARDAIARYNAQNRQNVQQTNLAARQNIENQRANIANQQAQVGNQISQQRFQNEMSKATGQGQVASNMSNIAGNAPAQPSVFQSALGGAATGAGVGANFGTGGAGIGAAVGAGAGLLGSMFEDGGIVGMEGGVPVDRKALEDQQREKDKFKKKYMKKIHEEMLGENEPKYDDGGRVSKIPGMFDFSSQGPSKELIEQKGGAIIGQGNDATSADIQTYEDAQNLINKGSGIDEDALLKGLGSLNEAFGAKPQKRNSIKTSYSDVAVKNVMQPVQASQFGNPFSAEDGGMAINPILKEIYSKHNKKPTYASDGTGDIIDSGMGSFAGDRVDAKVNDGEIILNIPQQQRLMDLLRGEIGLTELGDDDIVEGVPREYRDSLHEELEEESRGSGKAESLKKLLDTLE